MGTSLVCMTLYVLQYFEVMPLQVVSVPLFHDLQATSNNWFGSFEVCSKRRSAQL